MASSVHLTHQRWLPKHHHDEPPLGMTPYGIEEPYSPNLNLLEVLLCTGGQPLPSHRLRAAELPAAREGRAGGDEKTLKWHRSVLGDNLPSLAEVVKLYRSKGITAMRIYDPESNVLRMLSGISLLMDVPNKNITAFATSPPATAA
ncbi:hypothetical protein QYE76_057893 [Lolium multiflorum]|uniref:Glucan endo-1,3-beta-D-glucosidase n=1 Tax=Lolium multiflorum TaxID=4521 RepID=A0AAD8T5I3_LOLMU|nr:hypothetical protein QYE76_057893 [Lolium multiflorum]